MSTETIRLIREGGMALGEEDDYILYTYHYTVTTRMTPALRQAESGEQNQAKALLLTRLMPYH